MKKEILFFFIFIITAGYTTARSNENITGFYSGKLGKNLVVTFSLKQTGSEISGYYHYNKNDIDIRLQGNINSGGNVSLKEFGYFKITGYWEGKISGGKISGTWSSGNRKRHMDFSLNKISLNKKPGEPMSDKIAFGENIINLSFKSTSVPSKVAAGLFNQMLKTDRIDTIGGYNKDLIKKGETNPSILFTGRNVDLNNNGVPELIVYPSGEQGACTSQNCPLWIFEKAGNEYKQILSGIAGVFGYVVLNFTAKGFHDLALIQHSSAVEHEYIVYSFNGVKYEAVHCITETAHPGENGSASFTYKEHPCSQNN